MASFPGIATLIKSRGKRAFLSSLPLQARILDVGCGNSSPYVAKTVRPDVHYTGLDVGDYRQERPNLADDYRLTTAQNFAAEIESLSTFDAVISGHNLEHCDERERVLAAMIDRLAPGGQLYLAFPSERSQYLPSRAGTLNYLDDPTHAGVPPNWNGVLKMLRDRGLVIDFAAKEYRPWVFTLIGLLLEPISALRNKVMLGTWQLHGFESIIWARKPAR